VAQFNYIPEQKTPIGGGTSAPLFSGAGLLLDLFFSVPGIGGLFRKLFAYATGAAGGSGAGSALIRKTFAYLTALAGAVASGAAAYLKHFAYRITGGGTSSGAAALLKRFVYRVLGGATTAGSAGLVKRFAYRVLGGVTSSGLAILKKIFRYATGLAGALASGAAITQFVTHLAKHFFYAMIGGARASGGGLGYADDSGSLTFFRSQHALALRDFQRVQHRSGSKQFRGGGGTPHIKDGHR